MQKGRSKDFIRLHTGILLAGTTGLFGRLITLTELPLVWWRMLIATFVLWLILRVFRPVALPGPSQLLRMSGCGVLLATHWVLFYGSIKASNVSIGVVCFALTCFFTAVIEPFVGHRRFSWCELLLSMVTLAGILLIFGLNIQYRTGIIIGTFSSLIYTLFSIYSKRVQNKTGLPSTVLLLVELFSGWGALSLVLVIYHFLFSSISLLPAGNDWFFVMLLASIFTIGPFLTQLQALRSISAFTVNLSYNLEPIYSIALAIIFFREDQELNLSFWIGILLIVLSVFLQTLMEHKKLKNDFRFINIAESE